MNNHLLSMESLRDKYGEFIDSCHVDEIGYKLSVKSDVSPYALCFAIFGKYLIGDNIFLLANKDFFDHLLRKNISKKRSECISNLHLSKPYLQLFTFTLSALKIINTLSGDPLREFTLEIIRNNPNGIIKNAGTFYGKPGTGNLSMFYGILLIHAHENLSNNMESEINFWVKSHVESMNINGFWGKHNSKAYLQFQNGYHQYEILDYLGVLINFDASKLVLSLADNSGRFAPYPGGGSCYDYDAIYMLTRVNSNLNSEIIDKTLSSILLSINPDNGFCESQSIRPLNFTNILAIIAHISSSNKASFYERTRIGMSLIRPKNNKISTHWSHYSREWSESNLWDAWFRILAIARIRIYNQIDPLEKWGFINFPGIGYHVGFKK